jgi:hypothetical protein
MMDDDLGRIQHPNKDKRKVDWKIGQEGNKEKREQVGK